jgi:multidrug resistance efflux pump
MKQYLLLILLLAFGLSACGANSAQATPLPTVELGNAGSDAPTSGGSNVFSSGVAASGFVLPAQDAQLAFSVAGKIAKVNTAEGQVVKAGDLLLELDNTSIQLEVAQAERTLRELTSATAIASAEQSVANARKVLEDAEKEANRLNYPRASDTLRDKTQGEIDLAQQALTRAADAYRQVARLEDGDPKKAAALVNYTNAQLYLDSLIAKLNWYEGKASDVDAAIANANLDAAKVALQESEWYVAALKGEQLPAEATGARLAQLEQARDALSAAKYRLDQTRLLAPIDGTIITLSPVAGEFVSPGQVVIVISDVANLYVETTDLSERDVPKVSVGQNVTVFVEALNTEIPGTVLSISPVSNTLGGDVVYKTKVTLENPPTELRSGMSVEVRFSE